MNQIEKLEVQAENYKKELGRYRRELEGSGMSSEDIEDSLEQAQDLYNQMINNVNNLKR